ncbi:MAG: hypothetical protein JRJ00_08920 [Deltaproteobacteria bacterium]|nr:hypothetical protein [Deltaproteobacteria bacterium]
MDKRVVLELAPQLCFEIPCLPYPSCLHIHLWLAQGYLSPHILQHLVVAAFPGCDLFLAYIGVVLCVYPRLLVRLGYSTPLINSFTVSSCTGIADAGVESPALLSLWYFVDMWILSSRFTLPEIL